MKQEYRTPEKYRLGRWTMMNRRHPYGTWPGGIVQEVEMVSNGRWGYYPRKQNIQQGFPSAPFKYRIERGVIALKLAYANNKIRNIRKYVVHHWQPSASGIVPHCRPDLAKLKEQSYASRDTKARYKRAWLLGKANTELSR